MDREIKINASDIDFLAQEFELKKDAAKSYLLKAQGDLDAAIDLVTASPLENETKFN